MKAEKLTVLEFRGPKGPILRTLYKVTPGLGLFNLHDLVIVSQVPRVAGVTYNLPEFLVLPINEPNCKNLGPDASAALYPLDENLHSADAVIRSLGYEV